MLYVEVYCIRVHLIEGRKLYTLNLLRKLDKTFAKLVI